jgi:hypothetical protein
MFRSAEISLFQTTTTLRVHSIVSRVSLGHYNDRGSIMCKELIWLVILDSYSTQDRRYQLGDCMCLLPQKPALNLGIYGGSERDPQFTLFLVTMLSLYTTFFLSFE